MDAVNQIEDAKRAEATDDSISTVKFTGGTIVAFDGSTHRILSNGEIVVRGDRIVSVGCRSDAVADRTIELGRRLAIPGLISTHAHIGAHEATRLILDGGRREFMRSGFLNYVPTRGPGGPSLLRNADREASVRFGLHQLLRNGVTTVIGFDGRADSVLTDAAAACGIRLYFAPAANAGRYHFDRDGRMNRVVDEKLGLQELDVAADFIASQRGGSDGRVQGIVVLDEFYNSTPSIRRRAKEIAVALGVRLTMHFSEQLFEFHETVRTTGRTPVQILADEGVIGPEVILAHCIYVAGHSMTNYPYVDDLAVIAASGASVAHSPAVFARRGVTLESFQRYVDAGINMALGTDVFPMDLIEEMRMASITGKITNRNHEAASSASVFDAATIGSSKALGRTNLGRLTPGAKADIVVIDLDNMWTAPYADPIRALVMSGHPSMIDLVMVDGRILVNQGRFVAADEASLITAAGQSLSSLKNGYADWHWASRSVQADFPASYADWHE